MSQLLHRTSLSLLTASAFVFPFAHTLGQQPDLAMLKSPTDFAALLATTSDAALKAALEEHRTAVLGALERQPHVAAVAQIVVGAHGKVEKINATPESLKKAAGGDLTVFDTLKLIDLAVPNAGPHAKREVDPYDAAFFEHVGYLTSLESLNVISTKFNDEWMPAIAKLTNLRTLRFTNNGKLTDVGMEQLAGLKNLEVFSLVGTAITGRAYAKFDGFTKLLKVSHRGSSINDEGLQALCDHLPNLESISLAHAKFTDAGAPHLAKLAKLKSLEIGTANATPQALVHLAKLPLESLQLGEGFESVECLPLVKTIGTLRRLTLTNAKALTDVDLKIVASLTQLEHLEMGKLPLPDERLGVLRDFAFLKSMRLVPASGSFNPEAQDKIKSLLPSTALQFK
ncbi:MAG: leucine-rich repeat domain-containing protein [Roseimicrobium sp.]